MRKYLNKIEVGIIALTIGMPLVSLGQVAPPTNAPQSFGDIENILRTAMNWLFSILMILAVIFVLYAAFLYLTAAGNEEKVKKANHTILYAVIAIGVAIFARVVPRLVGSFFGTNISVF